MVSQHHGVGCCVKVNKIAKSVDEASMLESNGCQPFSRPPGQKCKSLITLRPPRSVCVSLPKLLNPFPAVKAKHYAGWDEESYLAEVVVVAAPEMWRWLAFGISIRANRKTCTDLN